MGVTVKTENESPTKKPRASSTAVVEAYVQAIKEGAWRMDQTVNDIFLDSIGKSAINQFNADLEHSKETAQKLQELLFGKPKKYRQLDDEWTPSQEQ